MSNELEELNPANSNVIPMAVRRRIPMTVPQNKLSVPAIPGWKLYWMRGTPDRLQQAERAGYIFVEPEEVVTVDVGLGGDGLKSGSTDMGSRVSLLAGEDIGVDGQPIRLYLMKQRQEDWEEDRKLLEEQTQGTVDALRAGYVGAEQDGRGDTVHRYVDKSRTKLPDMFNRNKARVPVG